MFVKQLLFALLVVAWQRVQAQNRDCSEQNVDACFREMEQKYNMDLDELLEGDIVQLKDVPTDEICSEYRRSDACLDGLLANCDYSQQLLFKGLKSGIDFLCGRGRKGFDSHRQCLQETGPSNAIKRCLDEFFNEVQNWSANDLLNPDVFERLCALTNRAIDCGQDDISEVCDVDAENWLSQFKEQLLAPVTGLLRCHRPGRTTIHSFTQTPKARKAKKDDGGSSAGMIAGIVVTLLIIIIIVVLGIVAVFYYTQNKKKQRALEMLQNRQAGVPYAAQPGNAYAVSADGGIANPMFAAGGSAPYAFFTVPQPAQAAALPQKEPIPAADKSDSGEAKGGERERPFTAFEEPAPEVPSSPPPEYKHLGDV